MLVQDKQIIINVKKDIEQSKKYRHREGQKNDL